MHKINIKIQVCGVCGTGKTSISDKIARVLRAEGFEVNRYDDYENEPTEEETNRNLKTLAPKTIVDIDSVQIRKVFNYA